MNFASFFAGIGRFLGRTFGIIRKVVPEDWLEQAIALARAAALSAMTNDEKREWVIAELDKRIPGISESTARLLVELAVKHLKADDHDAAKAPIAVPPAA